MTRSIYSACASASTSAARSFRPSSRSACTSSWHFARAIASGVLKTAATFDFETQATYHVRVEATDSHGGTFDKPLTVTVTDVNDAPVLDLDSTSASFDVSAWLSEAIGSAGAGSSAVGSGSATGSDAAGEG